MAVLVVNAGSTSVKLRVVNHHDQVVATADLGAPDEELAGKLDDFVQGAGQLEVAGHRVVHGGDRFRRPVLVDTPTRPKLEELSQLAPLHNPPALAGIDALRHIRPGLANVACFDTAFHSTLPESAFRYALPHDWTKRWNVRRYGFHGLSCDWSTRRSAELLERPASALRLVICHLGGGASVTAVASGRSVDTTMGFTPLEGLIMGTRSGDVDPGALVWMLKQGLTLEDLDKGLEHFSGLKGLAPRSGGDMRTLLEQRAGGDEAAAEAWRTYLHRLRAKIAAMTSAMSGLDALVFTGGIGERSALLREETCAALDWLGVRLDASLNEHVSDDDRELTAPGSTVRTLVVHAREDLVIAAGARATLGLESGVSGG